MRRAGPGRALPPDPERTDHRTGVGVVGVTLDARGPGAIGAGSVLRRVVREPDDGDATVAGRDREGVEHLVDVAARAHSRDARIVERVQRVPQCHGPEIQHVVVRKRHAVDADGRKRRNRPPGVRAEVERPLRLRPPLAARRQTALQVTEQPVQRRQALGQVPPDFIRPPCPLAFVHPPAEHHVAGEAQRRHTRTYARLRVSCSQG